MTLRIALSKLLPVIRRAAGFDTAEPMTERAIRSDEFARAAVRPIYARNGVRVSVSPRTPRE